MRNKESDQAHWHQPATSRPGRWCLLLSECDARIHRMWHRACASQVVGSSESWSSWDQSIVRKCFASWDSLGNNPRTYSRNLQAFTSHANCIHHPVRRYCCRTQRRQWRPAFTWTTNRLPENWKWHQRDTCGVTLDRSLTYRKHTENVRDKVKSRCNIISKRTGTDWGAPAPVLRTSAIALVYSVAEYRVPVWGRCAQHVDTQLNIAMRTVSGVLIPTNINWLPVLSNIELPHADSPWPCHPAWVQEVPAAHGSCYHQWDPTWATQVASQILPTFRDRGCTSRESKPNGAGEMGSVVDWRGATRTWCRDKHNVSTTLVHSTETSGRHSKSSEMWPILVLLRPASSLVSFHTCACCIWGGVLCDSSPSCDQTSMLWPPLPDYSVVDQVPVFRSMMHPRCLTYSLVDIKYWWLLVYVRHTCSGEGSHWYFRFPCHGVRWHAPTSRGPAYPIIEVAKHNQLVAAWDSVDRRLQTKDKLPSED